MKQFVFGTVEQYRLLDQKLSAGIKYEFPEQEMPSSCSRPYATIWFGKENEVYIVCVDKDITVDPENADLQGFLKQGYMRFVSLEDMVSFFHSFQSLYDQKGELENEPKKDSENVIDKSKLHNIINSVARSRKKVKSKDIAEPLKAKVFGQDEVIDELCRLILINKQHKESRVLPIALIGPTATGKSETARSLADIMSQTFGTQYGFIEIAGSEFIGSHTVHRFFGSPPGYVGHGGPTILDPVRKNPNHVIVINEIEKADLKILVGLMEAIDTGMLGMADNSGNIDLNQCIILFTSNIPIDMDEYMKLSEFERTEMCRNAFTKHCGHPEISGKIGNFLVYRPLDNDAKADIIVKFVREELDSFNLTLQRIDEHLMVDFLKHETKYGARGIRALVTNSLGKLMLDRDNVEELEGKQVVLSGTIDNIQIRVI